MQSFIKNDEILNDILENPLTISLGVGELNMEDSKDGLISKVDNALYTAKALGKNQLVIIE